MKPFYLLPTAELEEMLASCDDDLYEDIQDELAKRQDDTENVDEATAYFREQGEIFDDRYQAWRNEY